MIRMALSRQDVQVTVHRWGNTTFAEMLPPPWAGQFDPPAGLGNLREGIGMPMHLLPG
jgi:hypothetical protein